MPRLEQVKTATDRKRSSKTTGSGAIGPRKKKDKLTVSLYDQKGQEKGEVKLNPEVFGTKVNPELMAQAVRVRLINARLGTRKTKARSEVSGGGRKPWRQKGLGRARHGSIRSPLWVGGGHAHALSPTDFRLRLPVKMKRRALFSALSSRAGEGQVVMIDRIKLAKIKTKGLERILQSLPITGKVLIVTPGKEEKIELSARNLPNVKTLEARLLNTYDVLGYPTLLVLKASLKTIEEVFLKR